jgi:mono/diheme cytochrome c family protein
MFINFRNTTLKLFGLALIASVSFASSPAVAEKDTIGSEEFRISCASCHGIGGKGDGAMTPFLKTVPSDLTGLAKKNDGKFPFFKTFQIIDGRTLVGGHGERTMPVWGSRYRAEAGEMYGPYGGEIAVRARVMELVYYIQTIQQ